MRLILVRHTKVGCDKEICYGHSDVELASTFEDDISNVISKLNDDIINIPHKTVVYSSPLKRCETLANNIIQNISKCKKQIEFDERLKELNFGSWEMQNWSSINQYQLQNWGNDFVYTKCPDGESFLDLYERCNDFLIDLQMKNLSSAILVTHSGVIRAMLCIALGMPLENAFRISLDYGSLSKIMYKNSLYSIIYINR